MIPLHLDLSAINIPEIQLSKAHQGILFVMTLFLSTAGVCSFMRLISLSRTSILLFIPLARPSRRRWLISSWVSTSISRLRFPSFWGGRRRLCTLAHLVVSPPLMKLSMLRELRDLNSVVIIRELSPNTSSVSLTVRILFSEIMLWYDHDPAVTLSLDLTLLFPTLTI